MFLWFLSFFTNQVISLSWPTQRFVMSVVLGDIWRQSTLVTVALCFLVFLLNMNYFVIYTQIDISCYSNVEWGRSEYTSLGNTLAIDCQTAVGRSTKPTNKNHTRVVGLVIRSTKKKKNHIILTGFWFSTGRKRQCGAEEVRPALNEAWLAGGQRASNHGQHSHQVPQSPGRGRRSPGLAAVRREPSVPGRPGPQRLVRGAVRPQHAAALRLPPRHDASAQVRTKFLIVSKN